MEVVQPIPPSSVFIFFPLFLPFPLCLSFPAPPQIQLGGLGTANIFWSIYSSQNTSCGNIFFSLFIWNANYCFVLWNMFLCRETFSPTFHRGISTHKSSSLIIWQYDGSVVSEDNVEHAITTSVHHHHHHNKNSQCTIYNKDSDALQCLRSFGEKRNYELKAMLK